MQSNKILLQMPYALCIALTMRKEVLSQTWNVSLKMTRFMYPLPLRAVCPLLWHSVA